MTELLDGGLERDDPVAMEETIAGKVVRIVPGELAGAIDIMALRDAVYVNEKKRLGSVADMAGSFDRYDAFSRYFIAYCADTPVGCIKVVRDSELGLPCEDVTALGDWRKPGNVIVEFGHLLSLPTYRSSRLGLMLMRHALNFCVFHWDATHVIGDFFASENSADGLQSFYKTLGFQPVCKPYRDSRFLDSPRSIVAIMDIRRSTRKTREARGVRKQLLEQFFQGFLNLPRMNE